VNDREWIDVVSKTLIELNVTGETRRGLEWGSCGRTGTIGAKSEPAGRRQHSHAEKIRGIGV
jgi:hypothetical protein